MMEEPQRLNLAVDNPDADLYHGCFFLDMVLVVCVALALRWKRFR